MGTAAFVEEGLPVLGVALEGEVADVVVEVGLCSIVMRTNGDMHMGRRQLIPQEYPAPNQVGHCGGEQAPQRQSLQEKQTRRWS